MENEIKKFINVIKSEKGCINDVVNRYKQCNDEDLQILRDCIDFMIFYNEYNGRID